VNQLYVMRNHYIYNKVLLLHNNGREIVSFAVSGFASSRSLRTVAFLLKA
jgi:hypothetical protein